MAQVQLLTVPCYFLGAATYMCIAFLSDRTRKRGLFCVIFGTISVVGYGVLISPTSQGVHYFGCVQGPQLLSATLFLLTHDRCFLVATGLYVVVGLPLAWVSRIPPAPLPCYFGTMLLTRRS